MNSNHARNLGRSCRSGRRRAVLWELITVLIEYQIGYKASLKTISQEDLANLVKIKSKISDL